MKVYRIPTGPYRYSRINITAVGSATGQLDRGWTEAYSYIGTVYTFTGKTSSFIAEDNPANPVNHYLRFASISGSTNITIIVEPLTMPYLELGAGDFFMWNITTKAFPPDSNYYKTPLAISTTDDPFPWFTAYFTRYGASLETYDGFGFNGAQYFQQLTGIPFALKMSEVGFLTQNGNATVVLSKPRTPLEWTAPTTQTISLKPRQPLRILINFPNMPSNRPFNITVRLNATNIAPNDRIEFGASRTRWPTYVPYDAAVLTSSSPNRTISFSACHLDMTVRRSFIWAHWEPYIIDYEGWQSGTSTQYLTADISVTYFNPEPLISGQVVTILPGSIR